MRIWDYGFYIKFAFRNPKSKIRTPKLEYASLAQLVEQLIRNEQVVGSSPIGGSPDCGLRITDCGLRVAECGVANFLYFCIWFYGIVNSKSQIRNLKSEIRNNKCGNSSVGRALASQAKGREFESRFPLSSSEVTAKEDLTRHCFCDGGSFFISFDLL